MFKALMAATVIYSATVIVIGGLYFPHTLAGAVARFVFSLN